MQPAVSRSLARRKRIEIIVSSHQVPHIKNCTSALECEDFSIAPVISGWGVGGYWSSESTFSQIGKKIRVRFTADSDLVEPFLKNGFGLLAMDIVPISATDVIN